MAGAGTEVGRISIKVTPDTDGFREALRRQLKAATAGLDAEIPANLKNAAKVESQLNALARNRKTRIEVDNSLATRALRDIDGILKRIRSSGKNIKLFEDAAEGLRRKVLNVPLQPELRAGWEDDIRLELMRMRSLAVDIEPRIGKGQVGKETLAALGHAQFIANARKIQFRAEVDVDTNRFQRSFASLRSSLTGVRSSVADTMSRIGNSIMETGDKALASVGGIRAFGMGMVALSAIAVLVPPALSVIAGSLTMLPGLLSGLLVPMAAVALGFEGIKKAAEDSGLFDPTGGPEGKGGVGKALDSIREAVSSTFEQGLKPAFQGVANLMPQLTSGFQQVAQGLSEITTQAVAGIQNRLPQVQSIISNIGVGLSNAAPGIRDFTSALIQLTEGLAQKFPSLGTAFSNMMSDFLAWADRFTFKDPISGASQFDHVLSGIKETANALWGALGKITGVSLDNLSREDFGQGMKNFFKAVEDFVTNTLPSLQRGFEAIASLADKLSPIFRVLGTLTNGFDVMKEAVGNWVSGDMEKPLKSIEAMQARMEQVKRNGGGFFDQWLEGASGTGNPGQSFFDQLPQQAAAAGQRSVTSFKQSFNQNLPVGTPITGADQMLTPVVDQAKQTGQQAVGAFKEGLSTVGSAGGLQEAFVAPIQQGAQQAQVASGQMAAGVQGDTAQAIALITGLGSAASAAEAQWSQIIGVMNTGASQVAAALSSQFANLPLIVMGAFNGVQSAVTGAMGTVVSTVATGASQINVAISAGLSQVSGYFTMAFAPLPGLVQGIMGVVVSTIAQGVSDAVAKVAAMPGQMAGAISAGAGALVGPGQALMAGLKQGIVAGMADVLAYVQTIAGQIAANKGPLPKDRKTLIPAGLALMEGLDTGLQQGMTTTLDNVKQIATTILEAIKEVFGSASGINLNFNFNGVGGGSRSSAGSLAGLQSSMSDIAFNAKGFQSAMVDSVAPTRQLTAEDLQRKEELSQQLAQLEMRRKELELARAYDKNNPAIKAELEQIKNAKLALGLEKDKLTYAQKYNGSVEDTSQKYADYVKQAASAPIDFARTAGTGFLNDFGISGGGVLGAAMDWGSQLAGSGIGMGSNYIFNVSNVDEAMAVHDNQVAKQGMGVLPR